MAEKIKTIIKEHFKPIKDADGKVMKDADGKIMKERVEVEYRIDAAFVPEKASEVCPEFIENYCAAKGRIEWLVAKVQKTIVDKNNKTKSLPFVNLRAEFIKEFFPEVAGHSAKKPSFKDYILAKYVK